MPRAASSDLLAALTQKLGSGEFLYQMVDHASVGILLIDAERLVKFANPAACRILGGYGQNLVGHHMSTLFGDCYTDLLSNHVPDGASDAPPPFPEGAPREIRLKTHEGRERIVNVVFVNLGKGSADHSLCYLTDHTALKQLQVELYRRNTFFYNLIDSSVDGIIASDMKGRIILFNKGAERILDYTEEEAITSLHVSRLYPEGEAKKILQRMRSDDYGGKGKLLRHELIAITKDGHHVPMTLSGGILYDEGEEIATFGIFTDLRDVRKIKQDLQQTHKMLLQSEKMAGLGRLAAGVAHEINNPMSGIMLYSALVLEQLGDDHPAVEDLKIVASEAERCKQIVADLLEFSHQTSFEQTGVDVNEQIRKALSVLEKQPVFHNIKVLWELDRDLSRIAGSPIRLNQVFMNIIVNAAQAMDGHGILAITTRHRSKGDIVEILIADNGPGIDKNVLPQIFDPFFTTRADEGGTGLGLSVSYAIAKEHRGSIRAESEPGTGTTFVVRFPALQQYPSEDSP